jgi:hypothetical protein
VSEAPDPDRAPPPLGAESVCRTCRFGHVVIQRRWSGVADSEPWNEEKLFSRDVMSSFCSNPMFPAVRQQNGQPVPCGTVIRCEFHTTRVEVTTP